MSKLDRVLVCGVLALLALIVFTRSPGAAQSAAADALADDPVLGPAAALTLRGEKGDLTLRNADGRIGWTKDAFGRVYTTGFVHISKPLRRIHESERFREEREALVAEISGKDAEYQSRLGELSERIGKLESGSPEHQELLRQGEQLYQEYMEWGHGAAQRQGKLEAEQVEAAYRQLVDAVEVAAERLGVDIVYRFITTADPFEATDLRSALNEVRFRSVLRYPPGLDITPEVMRELGFDD